MFVMLELVRDLWGINTAVCNGERLIVLWAIFLSLFYVVAGYYSWSTIEYDIEQSIARHENQLDPNGVEVGKTNVESEILREAENGNKGAEQVKVGLYVDRIVDLSSKETGWTVDFYIWFKWDDPKLKPTKTFQIVNGEMLSAPELVSRYKASDEGPFYAQYKVQAKMTKFFNITRYPLDNHLLTIRIEDKDHTWRELQYVPDTDGTELSSRVIIPGYRIYETDLIEKLHAYKSDRGDPLAAETQSVYSQLVYGIEIARPDWGLYFKMFQGIFASVAIAFLAFCFTPGGGDRIGLGVGAFFASVASSYISLNGVPGAGIRTLTDMVNGLAMVTIFLTLLGSILSNYLERHEVNRHLVGRMDRVSLFVFVIGYCVINIVIVRTASLS
jgi:hypothetical protein